jgi:RHS repeat-associated protein
LAFFGNKKNRRLLLLVFLLSLPVLAQEIIFTDGFENHPPIIISTPILTGKVGEVYDYDVNAMDIDGDTMLYLLTAAPAGMDINAVSGEISWTPDAEGDFPITVEVSDPEGGAGTQSWSINVAAGLDSDSDGLADYVEGLLGTDPNDPDSDDDGLNDGDEVNTYKTNPLDPDSDGDSLTDGNEANSHSTNPTKIDTDGDFFGDGLELEAGTDPLDPNDFPPGPPDPKAIATSVDPTVSTTLFGASSFIYNHKPPIQTGVAEGTIDPLRVAVLRGKVIARDGTSFPGVDITIHNHSEYGQTKSRLDGQFDLVINGGDYVTVSFESNGYLPVHRQVKTPWQDYVVMSEIVMVPLDAQVTTVDLSSGATLMAEGSTSNDVDGSRHAAVVFPAGTSAELVLADGSTQAITSLNIRATEYTVGDNGPAAMPGKLPPASGYTYAVELSADETLSEGISGINFSQPVFNYVENFLGMPVGSIVPSGYYDKENARWLAAKNGLVIKIISITDGKVDVDIDGDDVADTGAALSDIGFTDAERQSLAASYTPGQSLWRVPISHFTPWDHNWPFGPPPGATPPRQPPATAFKETEEGSCEYSNEVEFQNQVVQQEIPITGTSFTLNYRSTNVPDWDAGQSLDVPLSEEPISNAPAANSTFVSADSIGMQPNRVSKSQLNSHSVPSSLKRIELELTIAGQKHSLSFPPLPDQSTTFTWDGTDVYNREMHGKHTVNGTVGYVYDAVYFDPSEFGSAFDQFGSTPVEVIATRQELISKQPFQAQVGTFNAKNQGIGGWMLNVHKVYDPVGGVLVSGNGSTRGSTLSKIGVISSVAGSPDSESGFSGDGGPAVEALLLEPRDVFALPDGSVLITDTGNNRIRRISPEGIISTIAGNGSDQYSGDGGPALSAGLAVPVNIAAGPDGSIYFTESGGFGSNRIRKITPDGVINTIAGTGPAGHSGDGGPAAQASISSPRGLAIAPDGTVYFGERKFTSTAGPRVRKIDTNGIIHTIAGGEETTHGGDGGPALEATFEWNPEDLAIGPEGNIFIAVGPRVRAITPDGLILTIAGNGTQGFSGDGGFAWQAQLSRVVGLTVSKDALYIADNIGVVRSVSPDGIISTVVGDPNADDSIGDGGPVLVAGFDIIGGLSIDQQGRLYIVEEYDDRIRLANSSMPGFGFDDIGLASADASEFYQFNSNGKHLRTLNSLTGAVMYEFGYDTNGQLTTVTDGYNNVTTIQHDSAGNPSSIASSFGQLTSINVDRNGFINKITNPAGEKLLFESSVGGLITKTTDPRGKVTTFDYNELGRLTSHSDNSGFSQSLARTQTSSGFSVTRTTGLSRTATFDVAFDVNNVQQNINTAPDGSQNSSQFMEQSGGIRSTSATGMLSTISEGPDPRFGMQAAIMKSAEVTAPGGSTFEVLSSSEAELSDPADPFSLVSLSGTATVDGRMTSSVYTAANKTLVMTSPEGRVSKLVIDNLGRVVSSQFGDMAPVTASYNILGQLETLTTSTGDRSRVSSITYGADGFWNSITDPLGRTVSYTRDSAGRITVKTLPGDVDVVFGYNAAGELGSITPPSQPKHSFTYTLNGQVASIIPPFVQGTGPTTFNYNADQQLTTTSRPGDEEVSLEYDNEGRVQFIELLEGGFPASTYTMSYLIADQLASITGPGAQTLSYTYEGDLVISETWGGVVEGSVAWSYDNAFLLASETVAGGATINFGYDDDDLLTSAGTFSIVRNAANGLVNSAELGVVGDTWAYNGFGEVESYSVSTNATPVYEASYTRDDLGRIMQKVETIGGVTDTYVYDYDVRGQLIEVQKNSVAIERYSYDVNGNRTNATVNSITYNATYDDQDRLLVFDDNEYRYTAAGRLETLIEPGGLITEFDYDIVGNLQGVLLPDATEVTHALDGSDRRIQRSVDGTITNRFLYDSIFPVAELDELGNVVSQFIYAGGNVPAYMIRGGVNFRIISDNVGSVRLVVNAETGGITQRIDYDAFGGVIGDTNPGFQPFGFAGGIYDPKTGLVLFGSRDYDSKTGRWTAKDPTGFNGDDSNLFRYANNNPVNLADPAGTGFWSKALGLVGGISDGLHQLISPGHMIQSAVEGMTDLLIGDWLDDNGYYRKPHAGILNPPPPGVNESEYLDWHFYGECSVDIASLGVGGVTGAARSAGRIGPAIVGRLGRIADKLRRLPNFTKGWGNAFGRARAEVNRLGQKVIDELLDSVQIVYKDDAPRKLLKGKYNKFDKARSGRRDFR